MSSEALAKPTITRNSSEFKQDAYASLSAVELVVFAVQLLQADAAPVAVEEVVSTCFRLFPHSFALKNYFYWPDSALVSRRLHDAKEKGLLKGSATDGYETKVQGRQVAKHVAKVLGVSLPVLPKVEIPVEKKEEAPADKKEEEKKEAAPSTSVVKAVKKQETRKKEVQQKAVKSEKKPAVKKKVQAKPKKVVAKPAKKKPAPKPVVKAKVKEKLKPGKPKVKKVEKKRETRPTVKPEVKKAAPKVEKKQEVRKKVQVKPAPKPRVQKAKNQVKQAQPKQLTMALPPVAAKKKAEAPATKPKVKEDAAKPVKGVVLAPVAVSKEEKDKAAKVVKLIERSDAYQLYRRNGRRAQIGEFDFRNMLFATMESSAETLKRNVELFKRYAGIHFRTDLIAFLEFCEENFSSLLISKAKVKGKR